MTYEPVKVQARWKHEGRFEPSQFFWRGKMYKIESTGRDWEDEEGLHILCMLPNKQVFELIFQLNPAGWFIRPSGGSPQAV